MTGRVLIFVIGWVLGVLAAVATFHTITYVDYDSGSVREVSKIGPFIVGRGRESSREFALLTIRNQKQGLTGVPDWHVAIDLWGDSRRSATFEGSFVLSQLRFMDSVVKMLPVSNSIIFKEQFLESISKRDFDRAVEIRRSAEDQIQHLYGGK